MSALVKPPPPGAGRGPVRRAEIQGRALLERFPESGRLWFVLGKLFERQSRYDEAIEAMLRARTLDKDAHYERSIAEVLTAAGRLDEAEEFHDEAEDFYDEAVLSHGCRRCWFGEPSVP